MVLAEYRRKRRFDKTPEPTGSGPARTRTAVKAAKRRPRLAPRHLRFVVQKHAARRLHYDLRLELDGVLLSWAVPKGPSLDPAEKRLAVHVEDHPLEYGDFEGRIPTGEYGAGEVIVWDRGTWTPDGDPRRDLQRGRMEFHLSGEKLAGGWQLVRMNGRSERDRDNWLLIKRRDDTARDHAQFDVAEELPESVKSGKRLKTRDAPKPVESASSARSLVRTDIKKLVAADYPLALATLVKEPPQGKQWLHEIKFDGYRLLAFVEARGNSQAAVQLLTRNQLDWSHRYPAIARELSALPVASAVIDGELVALDDEGISRFQLLQNAAAHRAPLVYYAFDLLHLDGKDLRTVPLLERKDRLRTLLEPIDSGPVRYSDHMTERGAAFLAECCRRGLEGIICKRADRPYPPGRTLDWLKIKCLCREELVIGGYTDSTAAGRPWGALLVGYFDQGELVYSGRVGTGFDAAMLKDLHRRLIKLQRAESPFAGLPARERGRGVHWVRPELVAQVEFNSWTDTEILRQASFQGLREDKPALSVGRPESLKDREPTEINMQPRKKRGKPPGAKAVRAKSVAAKSPSRSATSRKRSAVGTSAVVLTHPERMLFPEVGLTKQGLADYYAEIADEILPHVAGRPLSLLRCPEGVSQKCFFQKHAAAGTPDVLRRVPIEEKDGTEEYLVVDDADGLRALAQMSVLEIHPWGSREENVDQPDRLIFDLDPGPQVEWRAVREAALQVHDVLAHLGVTTFVKTSGGKGLHVVAPLTGHATWPVLKQFARAIAEHLAEQHGDRYTAKMAKAARPGRIFIDYLRNDRGATAVAPFSPRAKGGAPLSMPLAWEDLAAVGGAEEFTVTSRGQARGGKRRDPWKNFFEIQQKLPMFAQP